MDHTTKENGWSHGREADPFSKRQRLALGLGMGGIFAALVAALVTASAAPRAATGTPDVAPAEVRS